VTATSVNYLATCAYEIITNVIPVAACLSPIAATKAFHTRGDYLEAAALGLSFIRLKSQASLAKGAATSFMISVAHLSARS